MKAPSTIVCLAVFAPPLLGVAAPRPKQPAITEIRLRRVGDYKEYEGYRATFYWNGATVLEAREGLKYKGAYAGRMTPASFQRLSQLLMQARFFDLKEAYASPTAYSIDEIDVVRSGKRKRVMVWVGAGSPELQKAIVALRREVGGVDWKFRHKLKPLPMPSSGGFAASGTSASAITPPPTSPDTNAPK